MNLVARQLPPRDLASLAAASKNWQRVTKPRLEYARALRGVADRRASAAMQHFADLLDNGMTGWMNRLAAGDVPAGFVRGPKWDVVLQKYGMRLFIRRGGQHHDDIVLVLEAPRQGLLLQVRTDPLRVLLFHGADSADNAAAYADFLRSSGLGVRLLVKPDPELFAERPRRGDPRLH